jgi:geranylgeranyl pyrophosphate synthase
MRKTNAGEKDNLRNILEGDVVSENDLAYTLGLMTKHGAVDEALSVAQSHSNDAKAALTVFPNSMPRRALMALADFVVQREM